MTLAREADLVCRFRETGDSLRLEAGSITVLLGRNGAGKTHWLESLAGLKSEASSRLEVYYGNEPLWQTRKRGKPKRNSKALKAYSYSSQAPDEQLIAQTVEAELLETLKPYSLVPEENRARMDAALTAIGWGESWLSRSPFRLSGGERRRLAIACLLAAPCDWLLLDEPTAGLDAQGQQLLGSILSKRAQEGQGVVLISHDTEWALPLADRILLLSQDGTSLRECTPEELLLHPEWWGEAGMAVPAWLQVIVPLLKRGVPLSAVWKPSELARSWKGNDRRAEDSSPAAAVTVYRMGSDAARKERLSRTRPSIAFFDPRALWLSYVLLSIALLAQKSWWGVGAGAVITLVAIWWGKIPLRRWRGVIISFFLFTLSVSVVAGIGSGEGSGWSWEWGFQWDRFLTTLHSMARTFLVFLLGLGLSLSITPLRLRRSLESLLAFKGRVAPVMQKFLLTITLMLRFIPIFLSEWERFHRYAIARGKEAGSRSLRGTVKRLSHTILPFMLSLFRLGDQAAVALESRGVGRQKYPTLLKLKSWGRRDTSLVVVVFLVALLLWLSR